MYSTAFLDLPPLDTAGGAVRLPGSKSISNRVLLLAALSEGTTEVHDLLASDDTRVMLDALREIGCGVDEGAAAQGTVRITRFSAASSSIALRTVPWLTRKRAASSISLGMASPGFHSPCCRLCRMSPLICW